MKQPRLSFGFRSVALFCILLLNASPFSLDCLAALAESDQSQQVLEVTEDAPKTLEPVTPANSKNVSMLSISRLNQLASLMPPFTSDKPVSENFVLTGYTRKPPATRNLVEIPFPPPAAASPSVIKAHVIPRADITPLEVLRINHAEDVQLAGALTITFNQPMVPITSIESNDVVTPATINPQPEGKWQWIDTKTLSFVPSDGGRFPNATTYKVTVPAGITSISGQTLPEAYVQEFTTPEPNVVSVSADLESDGTLKSLKPKFQISFNQEVEFETIRKLVHCVSGAKTIELSPTPIATDPTGNSSKALRHVFSFTSDHELTRNTNYKLVVDPGSKSTEGPNRASVRYVKDFHTFRPLTLKSSLATLQRTTYYEPVSVHLMLHFNNELKQGQHLKSLVTISPKLPRMRVDSINSDLEICGDFDKNSKYTVRLDRNLSDTHEQNLGKRTVASLVLQKSDPQISFDRARQDAITQLLPKQNAKCRVRSVNVEDLNVEFYKVEPEDIGSYKIIMFRRNEKPTSNNMPLIERRHIKVATGLRGYTFTDIDLPKSVKDTLHRCVIVVVAKGVRDPIYTWVEYSPLGMHIFQDGKSAHILAIDAEEGKPLEGAEVTFSPSGAHAKTDKDGLASIPLPSEEQQAVYCVFNHQSLLMFERYNLHLQRQLQSKELRWDIQTDRALYRPGETVTVTGLVRNKDFDSRRVLEELPEDTKLTYVVTCQSDQAELTRGAVKLQSDGGFTIPVQLPEKTELGSFAIRITAEGVNDQTTIESSSSASFTVQEFRRPETEVKLEIDKGLLELGEIAHVKVTGTYGSGGALSHAKVNWKVQSTPSVFSPKGWDQFTFTPVSHDSFIRAASSKGLIKIPLNQAHNSNNATAETNGITAFDGTDSVSVTCKKLAYDEPVSLKVDATVQDLTRQEWTSSIGLTVLPCDLFVGIARKSAEYNRDDKKEFELVVVDKTGKPVSNVPISLRVLALPYPDSQHVSHASDKNLLQSIELISGDVPVKQSLKMDEPGTYSVTAQVTDAKGKTVNSALAIKVRSEPEEKAEHVRELHNAKLASESAVKSLGLVADKLSYDAGDVAKVTVNAPFGHGRGVFVVEKTRTEKVIPFEVKDKKAQLSVPIDQNSYPSVDVKVSTYGENGINARGSLTLSVPPVRCSLNVVAAPSKNSYEPDSEAGVSVTVRDSNQVVMPDAHVTVAVVDDSVLSLTGYRWYDPLGSMIRAYRIASDAATFDQIHLKSKLPGASNYDIPISIGRRGYEDFNLFQVEPTVLDERHYTSGRSERHQRAGFDSLYGKPVGFSKLNVGPLPLISDANSSRRGFRLRRNFNPLAVYQTNVLTDRSGVAHVTFKLPSNLTKYRIMVWATKDDDKFGFSNNSTFTVNKTLMVRPSFPRFMNYGDKAELTMVLENESNSLVNADVVMHAKNLVLDPGAPSSSDLVGFTGRAVAVPAHDRVEIRIPVEAKLGDTALVQAATITGSAQDSAEITFPLQPPITAEDFADYGQLDKGTIERKIQVPPNVIPGVGKLEISLSSTAMQKLANPARYLIEYPYECSEQLSSKIIGLVSLRDLLLKFPESAPNITVSSIDSQLERVVPLLYKRQAQTGSFSMWGEQSTSGRVNYFASVQCIEALLLAEKSGQKLPPQMHNSTGIFLDNLDSDIRQADLPLSCQLAIRAYASHVRELANTKNIERARAIVDDAIEASESRMRTHTQQPFKSGNLQSLLEQTLSLESIAWLLPTLVTSTEPKIVQQTRAMKAVIASHIGEQASTASVENNIYEDGWWELFYTNVRATALVLQALIQIDPRSDLIPKLTKTLSTHMSNGHWSNTQENARALAAMSSYFSVYEKDSPEFTALAWLGQSCVLNQTFVGRKLEERKVNIPMRYLVNHPADTSFILSKDGPGRLYYRVGLNYALKEQNQHAIARGFSVEREYIPVDKNSDVIKDSEGIWHVKTGSVLEVKVKIDLPALRHHVAVSDQLPAGFETINMAFNGNRALRDSVGGRSSRHWWRNEFEHTNFRDSRSETFASQLSAGHYDFIYFVRATTPGSFIVPPCKAEEMYTPETFGRTATTRVVVE